MTLSNLTELLAVMREHRTADEFEAAGLPVHLGEPDWTSLPAFGGPAPAHTEEVWSWDRDNLIVGTCADDIEIVPR